MRNVYAFGTGKMPLRRRELKKVIDFVHGLDGFITLAPQGEFTLLFFDTYGHAVKGRNLIKYEGNGCGYHIMQCEMTDDGRQVLVKGIADGEMRSEDYS